MTPDAAEKLRKMLEKRSEIVKKISERYGTHVSVKRNTISKKRWDYPEYVAKSISDGKPVPYVFVNEELVITGEFPSYEKLVTLLDARLK